MDASAGEASGGPSGEPEHDFPASMDQYPLPPDPDNRSAEIENVLAYMWQVKYARERGELPPACGFGRYLGVNPQGQPQRYQSKLDERWDHFTHWLHRKWTSGVDRMPNWAQTGYNKTYWGMHWVGEKVSYALGVDAPRYQWVIDAHRAEMQIREREEQEEAEAIREAEQARAEQRAQRDSDMEGGAVTAEIDVGLNPAAASAQN